MKTEKCEIEKSGFDLMLEYINIDCKRFLIIDYKGILSNEMISIQV
jgi:hypothetical protein